MSTYRLYFVHGWFIFCAKMAYHRRVSTSKNSVTLTVDPETVATGAIAQAEEQLSKFSTVTST